jgi:hypothetical protein
LVLMRADRVAEAGAVKMSLILCLLAIALLGVAGWGIHSVLTEMGKPCPQEPVDTISRRFEVESFIWSSRASRTLRHQYIATQACFVPAALCLAHWCG